jgi:hypothetical protein
LIEELGLEEPTYTDAYKDGYADGHSSGFRDGYAAATGEWLKRSANQPDPAGARAVFRKLANKWHPDHECGNAEVMRDINELWQAINKR